MVAVEAFSSEWAQLFKDEVNKSAVYRQAAKGWKFEPVVAEFVTMVAHQDFPPSTLDDAFHPASIQRWRT